MIKEPVHEGPAFLIHYVKDETKRDLLLVLGDTRLGHLTATANAVREISNRHTGWKAGTASIQDAAFPRYEAPDLDPGYFCFNIRHFYSTGSNGETRVHRDLLDRIIKRLLSDTPGTDFIQKSGIARGSRYFNRPGTRQQLLKEVDENRWLLLEAIRRFGKTSFMVNLEDQPPENTVVVYASLESGASRDYFARAMLAHALSSAGMRTHVSAKLLEGIEETWSTHEIFEKLMASRQEPLEALTRFWSDLSKSKDRILFLLDEVVVYLNNAFNSMPHKNRREIEKWSNWVRDMFAALNGAPEGVRFVLAGSMHLPVFLEAREIHLDLIYSMKSLSLSPVPQDEAETFLRLCLLQERVLAKEPEIRWIMDRFGGWIPSFLLYFVDLIGMKCRDQRDQETLSLQDIRSAYNSLFESRHRHLFSDLDEQPGRYDELFERSWSFTPRLRSMLVAAASGGVSFSELESSFHQAKDYDPGMPQGKKAIFFKRAVKIAVHDFSLLAGSECCKIACPLLSDWILSRKSEWGF
jgi:hypothetical protein